MSSTQWGAVVDALVTAMRATTGYRSPYSSAAGVPVYDGPEYAMTAALDGTLLIVGWSGMPGDTPEESGTSRQATGPLAANAGRPRDEEGMIRCRAVAQIGDASLSEASVKDARDATLAVVAAVETTLRATPTLGLVPGLQRMLVEMGTDLQIRQFVKAGVVCEIDFEVTYKARI